MPMPIPLASPSRLDADSELLLLPEDVDCSEDFVVSGYLEV